ncbi:MAG: hypothetical protein ACE5G6_05770 [Terriglobia bacterium]
MALALSLPLAAQIPPTALTGSRHSGGIRVGNLPQHVFVPGFGLRPVIHERFPVFGHGFDAHHFHRVRGHHGFGAGFGFRGGNFFFRSSFGFPSFHHNRFFQHTPFFSTPTVIVVPQAVPVQVPVIVQNQNSNARRKEDPEIVVPVGLPDNWSELRIERPSYAEQPRPLPQLTLLVLNDETIFAVTDYWLESHRIFYVTSSGRQGSLAPRDLDWETTNLLNRERRVSFILRAGR